MLSKIIICPFDILICAFIKCNTSVTSWAIIKCLSVTLISVSRSSSMLSTFSSHSNTILRSTALKEDFKKYQKRRRFCLFVCVEVLQPSQPNGVMSSTVSLPNHTFTGKA